MNKPISSFISSSATHTGMVRKVNEDSYISRDDIGLWAVADGMGGHQAGDVASQLVTKFLGEVPLSPDIGELLHATRIALDSANSELIRMDGHYDTSRVPGSTVVVLLLHGNEVAIAWVGDSRIYRLRNGRTEQITRDHSHVQELVDQHLISPEEAGSHPMVNVITRAIGIEEPLEIDVLNLNFIEGDQFLLCSDGLSGLLSTEELQNVMLSSSLEESVHSMIQMTLARGAPDNVTVISVQGNDDPTVVF